MLLYKLVPRFVIEVTMSLNYINRTLCDTLGDMRELVKTISGNPMKTLLSLVEEAQIYANRMEAGLGDKRDLLALNEETNRLRKELKALEKKKEKITGKKNKRSSIFD